MVKEEKKENKKKQNVQNKAAEMTACYMTKWLFSKPSTLAL